MTAPAPETAAGVLPEALLAELRELAEADLLSVYLSDPNWPFARSSYILIGTIGIDVEYLPYLRGPLKPGSLDRFSATDNEQTLLIDDVPARPRFGDSRFAKHHQVRSLARLSVRLADARVRSQNLLRMPPMLEIFVNYRRPLGVAELQERADRLRARIEAGASSIRKLEGIRRLLKTRRLVKKERRLERIVNELVERGTYDAPTRRLRENVRAALAALSTFILETCWFDRARTTISYFFCHSWEGADPEPVVAATWPEGAADLLKRHIAANPTRGIVRHVARTKSSVILDCVRTSAPRWRRMHLKVRHDGFSVTLPLFSGNRIACIISIESDDDRFDDVAGAELWRLLPHVERLIADVLAHRAQADTLDARDVLRALNTKPFAPRSIAVQGRLEMLGRFLKASELAFVEFGDDGEILVEQWRRRGRYRDVWNLRLAGFDELGRHLYNHPADRLISYQRLGDDARVRVTGYRIAHGKDAVRISRRTLKDDAIPPLHLADGGGTTADPGQAEMREDLVLPLWRARPDAPEKREVRGLLIVTKDGRTFSLTPLRVENLIHIADTFSSSIFAIDNLARKGALYNWAAAGVGPIHDLIHVANLCEQELAALGREGIDLALATERVAVIRDQLSLWYQMAQPRDGSSALREVVDLHALVDSAVRGALILTGEAITRPIECPVGVKVEVNTGSRSGITAVVSNALSNSIRWGLGIDRIHVGVDATVGEIVITVTNRVRRANKEAMLREAVVIARRVSAGAMVPVLESIAGKSDVHGLRGLGTWLASRVTRELLNGRYALAYRELVDDPKHLLVEASVVFPARVVQASSGEDTVVTGGGLT